MWALPFEDTCGLYRSGIKGERSCPTSFFFAFLDLCTSLEWVLLHPFDKLFLSLTSVFTHCLPSMGHDSAPQYSTSPRSLTLYLNGFVGHKEDKSGKTEVNHYLEWERVFRRYWLNLEKTAFKIAQRV